MSPLTPEALSAARQKWESSRPGFYRLVIAMEGDRVESGEFEVTVRGIEVISVRRNGQVVLPGRGQDYSMDGLFRMLAQELELTRNPGLLGAPPGYRAYPMANFDEDTGQIEQFRRTVGGTENTVDLVVLEFVALQ
jgi:hypothetical protein